MNKKLIMLSAVIAMSHGLNAMAQSTATISTTNSAANAPSTSGSAVNAAAATSSADMSKSMFSDFHIKYTGIFAGPGFSNELNGKRSDGSATYVSNRPELKYGFNEDLSFGYQARIRTAFTDNGMTAANENHRLYVKVNNIAKSADGIFSFDVLARAYLPTSNAAHDASMMVSPEVLPTLNINPANSRLSIQLYPQVIYGLYSDTQKAESHGAMDLYVLGNIEAQYTLSGKTQLTFGFYPEYASTKTTKITSTSNELDLGVNWDFMKGWALNPYLSAELNNMGAGESSATKNMAANIALSGTFL